MQLLMKVLLTACVLAVARGEEYDVTVVEHGVMVKEKVTMLGDGLQKYEVPQHRDLEQVEVYLDFHNEFMATKFVQLNKCQIASLPDSEPDQVAQKAGLEFVQKYIVSLGEATEKDFGRIEHPDPLSDITFLRKEIQEACQGLPVFWVDLVDLTDVDTSKPFVLPGSAAQHQMMTHRARRNTFYECNIADFNQKCKIFSAQHACYWFVLCPGLKASKACLEHVRSGNIKCVPCCQAADAPRDAKALFKHCDMVKW